MLYNLRQELLAGIRAATSDAGYDYEVDQSAIELEDITDEEKGEFSSPISFSIAAAAGAPGRCRGGDRRRPPLQRAAG